VDVEGIWLLLLLQVGGLTLQEVVVEVGGLTFYSEVLHVAQSEYSNNHGICTCLRALTRRNRLKIENDTLQYEEMFASVVVDNWECFSGQAA